MKSNIVKMSLVSAMLLTTGAYAGKVIGVDANASYEATTPPTQHGFGGWNLDNVNVRMVDAVTGEDNGLTFNESDGTYDEAMSYGDSFRSDILASDGTTFMGLLKGKDWPVGEPAGVKVVNNDYQTKNDKPKNCIMTTSYLSADKNAPDFNVSALLDSDMPRATKCSSPFQSHKRFKVNMLPASIVGTGTDGDGQPIDLVFNLDTEDNSTDVRRYQVFSKINNYTGVRLDGYKIQVLDENGLVNENLKFSLDISSVETDESGFEAVFAHGLWGPIDKHFPVNGFFDDKRSGFTQEGNNTQELIGGPKTLAGNYEDLFGLWLPSKWAPMGIFFDPDSDPTTDNEVVAFWGTAPDAPEGTAPAWIKGEDYNLTDGYQGWEPLDDQDIIDMDIGGESSQYTYGVIEDTLNLGPNYVVEVGENAKIGKTFTIRIIPHVAQDQTPPSYIDENGTYIVPPGVSEDIIPEDNTPVDPVDPEPENPIEPVSSGGGGGCTYNPNSNSFDMTFLMLMAMGLLYPFRRRFIK